MNVKVLCTTCTITVELQLSRPCLSKSLIMRYLSVAINFLMYSIQVFSQQMFKKRGGYSYFNDEVLRLRGFFKSPWPFATILKHFKAQNKQKKGGAEQ